MNAVCEIESATVGQQGRSERAKWTRNWQNDIHAHTKHRLTLTQQNKRWRKKWNHIIINYYIINWRNIMRHPVYYYVCVSLCLYHLVFCMLLACQGLSRSDFLSQYFLLLLLAFFADRTCCVRVFDFSSPVFHWEKFDASRKNCIVAWIEQGKKSSWSEEFIIIRRFCSSSITFIVVVHISPVAFAAERWYYFFFSCRIWDSLLCIDACVHVCVCVNNAHGKTASTSTQH